MERYIVLKRGNVPSPSYDTGDILKAAILGWVEVEAVDKDFRPAFQRAKEKAGQMFSRPVWLVHWDIADEQVRTLAEQVPPPDLQEKE